MSKSNYIYEVGDTLVKITDLDSGGMSVTNNAENVLTEIQTKNDIKEKEIIYKDSEGEWGVIIPTWRVNECVDVSFMPLYNKQ